MGNTCQDSKKERKGKNDKLSDNKGENLKKKRKRKR